MKQLEYTANSLSGTDRLGQVLADCLPGGTTVALIGTLGSGKTRLVQAIAAACGVPRELVVSPTFVLCHEYFGRQTLYHLDAYRLKDEDEFRQLGPEEYFASPAITLIEWADRVETCLPEDRLDIRIDVLGDSSRLFVLTASSPAVESALMRVADRLREPPRE